MIFRDLLFGTFHMPKGQQPGDDIGIDQMPNYPKSFIGLMLAPFTYNRIKKEAGVILEKERGGEAKS